jgi:hypothetical protein
MMLVSQYLCNQPLFFWSDANATQHNQVRILTIQTILREDVIVGIEGAYYETGRFQGMSKDLSPVQLAIDQQDAFTSIRLHDVISLLQARAM